MGIREVAANEFRTFCLEDGSWQGSEFGNGRPFFGVRWWGAAFGLRVAHCGEVYGEFKIGSRCWHEYVIKLGDVDGCNYGGSRKRERYLALKFEVAIDSF